jgi:hypothetical protein
VQARESAPSPRLEERGARVQVSSAPRQPLSRIEPTMFRVSPPVMEQRSVSIGPSSSSGFHMMGRMGGMGGHFGRR